MSTSLSFVTFIIASLSFRFIRLLIAIRKSRVRGRGNLGSRPIFWVMTSAYLLYFAFCTYEGFRNINDVSPFVSLLGLLLFVGALVLREKAMSDLGRFFSPDIEIRHEHQLIREGLYGYLRHPLLLCMALEIVGLGLFFNATRSLLWFGIAFYFPLIVLRQKLEERMLIQSLGEAYRTYQREVGAFWPRFNI